MMISTKVLKIARTSLLVTVAISGLGFGMVVASSVENYVSPGQAASAEKEATKAFAEKDYLRAIKQGERALAGDSRNASYRMLLGQANLSAGRFASAETLFQDVLTLDPSNGRAALNLALSQIALGHAAEAHTTLEANHDQIAAADYGLALALAGDTSNGVRALEVAAHADDATAKTRQNLALAYALAGRWDESKTTASQDLAADMVDKRMSDWAQMAHPAAAWEQVATLLHVTPTSDPGLPYQLALKTGPNTPAYAATAPVVSAPIAEAASQQSEAARFEVSAASAPAAQETFVGKDAPAAPAIVFAAPKAVVMPTQANAPLIHAASGPSKRFIAEHSRVKSIAIAHSVSSKADSKPLIAHNTVKNGRYAVQIGSFASVSVAHASWNHSVRKVAALRNYSPAQSQFKLRSASFYRLAVTGFATRADASQMCAKLRASGGNCFVRLYAGDQLASWLRKGSGTQMAAHAIKAQPKLAAKVAPKAAPAAKLAAKPVTKPSTPKVAAKAATPVTPKAVTPKAVAKVQKPVTKQLASR